MRSFVIAGILTVIAATGSTGLAIYAQDYVQKKALQQRVVDRAADWQTLITVYAHALNVQRQATEAFIRGHIIAIEQLIAPPLSEGRFVEAQEDILTHLSEQRFGTTGYVWVIDSDGTYILSKDRTRDGENILELQNNRDIFVVQDIIADAQTLGQGEIGTYVYYWQTPDDPVERDKHASYIYFPEIDWIVGASIYYDDVENTDDTLSLEKLKNMLAAQKLGASGYFIARTSDGVYEVSKDRVRDGENIWDVQDADGNYIVQEHTQTALENPESGTFSEYYWQNNDDSKPREKVGSYAYVEDSGMAPGQASYMFAHVPREYYVLSMDELTQETHMSLFCTESAGAHYVIGI